MNSSVYLQSEIRICARERERERGVSIEKNFIL